MGLKPSESQPPTWKGLVSGASDAELEVAVAVIAIGSQEVGLRVNSGRPNFTATERRSSGIPSRMLGNGSETALTWAVSGSTRAPP